MAGTACRRRLIDPAFDEQNFYHPLTLASLPQVYSIPLGGTMVETKFAIGGSGSAYITGLVDATFRGGMSEDECRAWVQRSVAHAMSRDASSGGCVRTVAISGDGVRREFLEGNKLPFM